MLKETLEKIINENKDVELTEKPNESKVSKAWPKNVLYKGKNLYEIVYDDEKNYDRLYSAVERKSRGAYDIQEVYLGYDPSKDMFVMGFDVFYDDETNCAMLYFEVEDDSYFGTKVYPYETKFSESSFYNKNGCFEKIKNKLISIRLD
jgi:hypothetical protein